MRLIKKTVRRAIRDNPELLVWQSIVHAASFNR